MEPHWRDAPTPKLGDRVYDTVTGFAGTITATTTYLHGETRCAVETLEAGKLTCEWFDLNRLEVAGS